MFSAYSRRSVTLRGVVKYQPGNAPCVLARLDACMEADWLRESFFSSHQVTLKIASQAPDVSSQTLILCVIGR